MDVELKQRFGFLVNDVARLYGRRFDRLARDKLGLSLAQCRVIGVISLQAGGTPLSQVALAELLDMTPMGVTALCDRMQAAGWIRREPSAEDGRVKLIALEPKARKAMVSTLRLGEALQNEIFATMSADEHAQLIALLRKVHLQLSSTGLA